MIRDLHPNSTAARTAPTAARPAANGNLYCPATPTTLLARGRTPTRRDRRADRHPRPAVRRTGRATNSPRSPDATTTAAARVICPAAQGKIRCPLRPEPISPTATTAPPMPRPARAPARPLHPTDDHRRRPPMNAKTAREARLPLSLAHRTSYNRRTAAERTFATLTDRATNDLSRGWCRQMGLTRDFALHAATALMSRATSASPTRSHATPDNQRRETRGLRPNTANAADEPSNTSSARRTPRPNTHRRPPRTSRARPPTRQRSHHAVPTIHDTNHPRSAPSPSRTTHPHAHAGSVRRKREHQTSQT